MTNFYRSLRLCTNRLRWQGYRWLSWSSGSLRWFLISSSLILNVLPTFPVSVKLSSKTEQLALTAAFSSVVSEPSDEAFVESKEEQVVSEYKTVTSISSMFERLFWRSSTIFFSLKNSFKTSSLKTWAINSALTSLFLKFSTSLFFNAHYYSFKSIEGKTLILIVSEK